MDERILHWTSFCSVMSRVRSQLLLASRRSSIVIWRQGSSKGFLRPTGLGRMGMFLCMAIIGKGCLGKKLVGTIPKSVGLGRFLQNLMCIILLICFFLLLSICDSSFLFVPCISRSSIVELRVERGNFTNFGY